MDSAGTEGALDEPPFGGEPSQDPERALARKVESENQIVEREGAVASSVTQHEVSRGIGDRRQEGVGDSRGQRDPDRIAIAARVFDRDVAPLATQTDLDGTPGGDETGESGLRNPRLAPLADLVLREVAEAEQEVVDSVDARGMECRFETLELAFERIERVGVEEFAKLGLSEELAKLRGIDRERLRSALGERRISFVDVVRDESEEDRRGKGRRRRRVDGFDPDVVRGDCLEHLPEGREIEDLSETLAVRLEEHRKGVELRGDGEEILRALSGLPER
jgi:hypothetical protein